TGKRYSEEDMGADAGSLPSSAVSGGQVFFSSHDGSLYALDSATGAKKWRFTTEAAWLSEPVALDGKVFIGTDEGDLCALDAVTGAKKWSVKMPHEAASISEPAAGASVVMYPSLIGGTIIAFDQETGRQRWKWNQTAKDEDWLCHGMRIKAVGYRVFVAAGECGQVAALESLTGKLAWDAQLQGRQDDTGTFLKAATLETVIAQTLMVQEKRTVA
ncbi:MAG: outer membrane protein assembly factor BamB family protein, partial [Desulfomonilaceae bacterium]